MGSRETQRQRVTATDLGNTKKAGSLVELLEPGNSMHADTEIEDREQENSILSSEMTKEEDLDLRDQTTHEQGAIPLKIGYRYLQGTAIGTMTLRPSDLSTKRGRHFQSFQPKEGEKG
ncbi:hypothetical protein F5B18DRAFT_227904 [Nemania serpens]|nr:hypothetical protein F5B18DRAFT_227904 [Nemania serpens]